MKNYRSIFYGTSNFGLPALEWLFKNTELIAVVTSPDKPVGRKQEILGSPIKQWAKAKDGLIIFQPNFYNDYLEQALAHLSPDIAIVADYGKIIPEKFLRIPKYRSLNLHVSLLPKYRGPSPMQTAILNREKISGVSLFVMQQKVDTGPIVSQREINLDPGETFQSLHEKSSKEAALLLEDTLEKYIRGRIKPRSQDESQVTHTRLFKKEDGKIDWQKNAEEIEAMVRALNPWPGTFAAAQTKNAKNKAQNLKIFKVQIADTKTLTPGEVKISGRKMLVGTGSTDLEILELQLEGSKRMSMVDFLAGFRGSLEKFI